MGKKEAFFSLFSTVFWPVWIQSLLTALSLSLGILSEAEQRRSVGLISSLEIFLIFKPAGLRRTSRKSVSEVDLNDRRSLSK